MLLIYGLITTKGLGQVFCPGLSPKSNAFAASKNGHSHQRVLRADKIQTNEQWNHNTAVSQAALVLKGVKRVCEEGLPEEQEGEWSKLDEQWNQWTRQVSDLMVCQGHMGHSVLLFTLFILIVFMFISHSF